MATSVLIAELVNDPLGRGYSGMTAEQAAASLTAANRTRARLTMSGDTVFQQTVAAEFSGLTAGKQQMWVSFCARSDINPAAAANVDFVKFIFGAAAATVTALAAARMESISRAAELGLNGATPGLVEEARRLGN